MGSSKLRAAAEAAPGAGLAFVYENGGCRVGAFLLQLSFHIRVSSSFSLCLHVNDGLSSNALFQALLILVSPLFTLKIDARLLHSHLFISWNVDHINTDEPPFKSTRFFTEISRWPRNDKNHNQSCKFQSRISHSRHPSARKSRVRRVHRQRSASWSGPGRLISWSKRRDRNSRRDVEVDEMDSDHQISRIGTEICQKPPSPRG
jgi:hypothetical protein